MSKSSTKQVHAKLLEMEAIGKKYAVRACAYRARLRIPCAPAHTVCRAPCARACRTGPVLRGDSGASVGDRAVQVTQCHA